jgi:hypothetical protein
MDIEIEMNPLGLMEALVGMFDTADVLVVPEKLGPFASNVTAGLPPLLRTVVVPAKPHCWQAGGVRLCGNRRHG